MGNGQLWRRLMSLMARRASRPVDLGPVADVGGEKCLVADIVDHSGYAKAGSGDLANRSGGEAEPAFAAGEGEAVCDVEFDFAAVQGLRS